MMHVPARRTARGLRDWLLAASLLSALTVASAQEASLPYTVRSGDKLIVLASELLVRPTDWNEVARFNGLSDPNLIRPGQTLNIPLRLMKSSPAAARVVSVEGDVRLNNQPATVGATVSEGARLKTGLNSSAVVQLADGSRMQMLPGSLAELVTSRNYSLRDASAAEGGNWFAGLLRLTQGAVETLAAKIEKRATPLQVQTPTSLVGVRGTRFRVATDAGEKPGSRAEVLEGLVRADNPAQQSGADLPKGTGAVIDPAQKDVQVVKLLPAPDLGNMPGELTTRQAAALPMPTLPGAVAFRLQVASDAGFERIARDVRVAATTADLSALPLGAWHLRLRGIDAQTLEGYDSARPLTIKADLRTWRIINSSLGLVGGKAQLSWTGMKADGEPLPIGPATAELARDQAFASVIGKPVSAGAPHAFDLGDLQAGRYFLRIGMADAALPGQPLVSEVYRLDVPPGWGTSIVNVMTALQPVDR